HAAHDARAHHRGPARRRRRPRHRLRRRPRDGARLRRRPPQHRYRRRAKPHPHGLRHEESRRSRPRSLPRRPHAQKALRQRQLTYRRHLAVTTKAKRRTLWLSAAAFFAFSFVCIAKWLPVAATVGDAYELQKVAHPYTPQQITDWNQMERAVHPWVYGAGASLLCSCVLAIFALRVKRVSTSS